MATITKERRDEIRAAAVEVTDAWPLAPFDRGNLKTRAHIANCDPQTIIALLDALASQAAEIARLKEALQGLTAKLEIVHGDPRYRCVWELAQMAQGPYAGPTYTDELAAARAALNGTTP